MIHKNPDSQYSKLSHQGVPNRPKRSRMTNDYINAILMALVMMSGLILIILLKIVSQI